jgi:hypothetical protein
MDAVYTLYGQVVILSSYPNRRTRFHDHRNPVLPIVLKKRIGLRERTL